MKVSVTHKNEMQFEAKTQNSSFVIDCPTISPIEYFLSAIVTCSATDVMLLPKNQNRSVSNLTIDAQVVRAEEYPRKFLSLHLVYKFDSDGDDVQAARWVMASLETYCSTINTIRDTTKISYDIIHNGVTIRQNEQMISGGGSKIDLGAIEACPS